MSKLSKINVVHWLTIKNILGIAAYFIGKKKRKQLTKLLGAVEAMFKHRETITRVMPGLRVAAQAGADGNVPALYVKPLLEMMGDVDELLRMVGMGDLDGLPDAMEM